MVTDLQTTPARPPQTGPITIHSAAKLSAQCSERQNAENRPTQYRNTIKAVLANIRKLTEKKPIIRQRTEGPVIHIIMRGLRH